MDRERGEQLAEEGFLDRTPATKADVLALYDTLARLLVPSDGDWETAKQLRAALRNHLLTDM